jgi:glutathione synthase/RimK-type ligase-like ATP-grasp enzyme
MKVGILFDNISNFTAFSDVYQKILQFNNIKVITLDISQDDFWEQVKGLDLFIFRRGVRHDHHQIYETIMPIIQNELGIKCFPDLSTAWHYDDKVKQYYLFSSKGLPIIKSWIFWSKKDALKWVSTANLPVVYKLKGGAGSSNVILIESIHQASKLIKRMFSDAVKINMFSISIRPKNIKNIDFKKVVYKRVIKPLKRLLGTEFPLKHWQKDKGYALFQKFLPNNKYDTRVTVIGNRAFAFLRYNRKNDFRASGSGMIDYDIKKIDKVFIEKAFEVSKRMNFQSMAYDFLYNEKGEPEFCEASYIYNDLALKKCSGYWDEKLQWHEGHFWPQYLQLVDALGLTELKQPII